MRPAQPHHGRPARPAPRPDRSRGRAVPSRLLRGLVSARTVALFAMLLQVLLFTDHIGASAVAGTGLAAPGERLGLLQVCTGEGIVYMTPDGRRVDGPREGAGHGGRSCPVCASAAMGSFDSPQGVTVPVFAAHLIAPPVPSLREVAVVVQRRASATPIRAPPVA